MLGGRDLEYHREHRNDSAGHAAPGHFTRYNPIRPCHRASSIPRVRSDGVYHGCEKRARFCTRFTRENSYRTAYLLPRSVIQDAIRNVRDCDCDAAPGATSDDSAINLPVIDTNVIIEKKIVIVGLHDTWVSIVKRSRTRLAFALSRKKKI